MAKFMGQRSKFKQLNRQNGWVYRTAIVIILLLVAGALVYHAARTLKTRAFSASRSEPYQSVLARSKESLVAPAVAEHPLFPYSIIAGGAYSREELARAIANDPVIARHYAAFDVKLVHVVRLTQDESLYASYRIGDRTYWTKRKITVRKGESILTDGSHSARARCGNLLSNSPQEPISPNEPRESAMDRPPNQELTAEYAAPPRVDIAPLLDPPRGSLELLAIEPPTLVRAPGGPPLVILPPVFFPPIGTAGTPPPPGGVPISTPESSTSVLSALGFAALALLLWFKRAFRPPADEQVASQRSNRYPL